jgi:hypothetical protein
LILLTFAHSAEGRTSALPNHTAEKSSAACRKFGSKGLADSPCQELDFGRFVGSYGAVSQGLIPQKGRRCNQRLHVGTPFALSFEHSVRTSCVENPGRSCCATLRCKRSKKKAKNEKQKEGLDFAVPGDCP